MATFTITAGMVDACSWLVQLSRRSYSPEGRPTVLKSMSSSLLWGGVLAVIIGVVSVAWPNITVGAFVILFAVYAFVAALAAVVRAFSSDRAGPVFGYLLLALLSVAAGIAALVWPGITAIALTILVAAWALLTGIVEVGMAFRTGEAAGERAMWALGGLVAVAFGVVLLIRPDIGAIALATVFGLFSIVYGVVAIVTGIRTRRAARALDGGIAHVAA
jgi:uncharacterized membrane protein HdeD (DUF308 family)